MIRIGREIQCLPYARFFLFYHPPRPLIIVGSILCLFNLFCRYELTQHKLDLTCKGTFQGTFLYATFELPKYMYYTPKEL